MYNVVKKKFILSKICKDVYVENKNPKKSCIFLNFYNYIPN